jgi:hypothetical protein
VAENKSADKPVVPNAISEQTGQFDARFMLWRTFCAEHNVPVETLPGDLPAEIRAEWEQFKNSKLKP